MRLRVRVQRQTSRVELAGDDPGLTELIGHIRETLVSSHGFSADTAFSLSLNGSELLTDSGQTLSACGIVSGDLICVVLPETSSGPDTLTDTRSDTLTAVESEDAVSDESAAGGPSQSPGPWASSWEPMLCSEAEEGQVPLSLELLYHSAQTCSPGDALMVAANLLMMETGFVPEGCELKLPQMPAGWRSSAGVYKLQYSHPLCGGSVVRLVGLRMGPVLVIQPHLTANQRTDTLDKLCLNPGSYVSDQQPGESAAVAFRDLRKLSRLFKDQLAYPLIAAAREAMSLPVAFGLAVLPPELLLRIIRLLDVGSVVRLSAVCRHFNVATADSTLWRHLYRRDFTDSDPNRPRDTDWKELYKRSYKLRSDLRRPRHCSLPPFHRNPRSMLPHPPSFPLVPGIIGGEYDQRPNLPQFVLPRPRFDPIGPLGDPDRMAPVDLRVIHQPGGRAADVRRGFI